MSNSAEKWDVGPIPGIDCPQKKHFIERREQTRKSLIDHLSYYHPEIFYIPFFERVNVLENIERTIFKGGFYHEPMKHASGKTAYCIGAIEWALLHGHLQFPLVIKSSQAAADTIGESILHSLANNTRLSEDFPEVCLPIRMVHGVSRKRLVYHRGQLIQMRLGKDKIILPNIGGTPSSCSTLVSISLRGSFRGLTARMANGKTIRPDLVWMDDPETREDFESCHRMERNLATFKELSHIGGPGKPVPTIHLNTPPISDGFLARNEIIRQN